MSYLRQEKIKKRELKYLTVILGILEWDMMHKGDIGCKQETNWKPVNLKSNWIRKQGGKISLKLVTK